MKSLNLILMCADGENGCLSVSLQRRNVRITRLSGWTPGHTFKFLFKFLNCKYVFKAYMQWRMLKSFKRRMLRLCKAWAHCRAQLHGVVAFFCIWNIAFDNRETAKGEKLKKLSNIMTQWLNQQSRCVQRWWDQVTSPLLLKGCLKANNSVKTEKLLQRCFKLQLSQLITWSLWVWVPFTALNSEEVLKQTDGKVWTERLLLGLVESITGCARTKKTLLMESQKYNDVLVTLYNSLRFKVLIMLYGLDTKKKVSCSQSTEEENNTIRRNKLYYLFYFCKYRTPFMVQFWETKQLPYCTHKVLFAY